jgi:alpha-2-macroglobulin
LDFIKQNLNEEKNTFYYDMVLKYFLKADEIATRDEGFHIERAYYKNDDSSDKREIREAEVGDVLKGRIKIIVPKERQYVKLDNFIPAGFELINFNLATENQSLNKQEENFNDLGNSNLLYPDYVENRNDRLVLFMNNLAPGEYIYEYYIRVLIPGKYKELPARISEIYRNENFGRTEGDFFIINNK